MCVCDFRLSILSWTDTVKLAFHDADTETDTDILADIFARIVARMSACCSACHRNNFRKSRLSDVSARILARMSVSVSASWDSSLTQQSASQALQVDCCIEYRAPCFPHTSLIQSRFRRRSTFNQPSLPSTRPPGAPCELVLVQSLDGASGGAIRGRSRSSDLAV